MGWEKESPLYQTRAGKGLGLVKCVLANVCVSAHVFVQTRGLSKTCHRHMFQYSVAQFSRSLRWNISIIFESMFSTFLRKKMFNLIWKWCVTARTVALLLLCFSLKALKTYFNQLFATFLEQLLLFHVRDFCICVFLRAPQGLMLELWDRLCLCFQSKSDQNTPTKSRWSRWFNK